MSHGTPMSKDKRFILVTCAIVAVLGLSGAGRAPNEQVLTFVATTLCGFMAQSQWGQTKRATADGKGPTP